MDDNLQNLTHQLEIERRDMEENCLLIDGGSAEIVEIKQLTAEIKCLQERLDFLKNDLKETLENAEFLVDKSTGAVVATYKKHINQVFDTQTFAKQMPTIYEKYLVNKERRTLLIK